MWDDMVDIDGNVKGKHILDDYIDEKNFEVDSDA